MKNLLLASLLACVAAGCYPSLGSRELSGLEFVTQPRSLEVGAEWPTLLIGGRDEVGRPMALTGGDVEISMEDCCRGVQLVQSGRPVAVAFAPADETAQFCHLGVDRAGLELFLQARYQDPESGRIFVVRSQAFAAVSP